MELFRKLFGGSKPQSSPSPMPQQAEGTPATFSAPPVPVEDATPVTAPPQSMHTRRLGPQKEFKTSNRRIRYGVNNDIGGRSNNEDAAVTVLINTEVDGSPPALGLFLVADGMGGHQNGEVASSLTARTVAQYVLSEIVIPQLEGVEATADQKTIPEVLAEAMSAANLSVQQQVPGGGTTVTCAVLRGDLAYIAHVGDSRAYLYADGHMETITRDHLLVRRLQELGQLTAQEADTHPQKNVLYRAIGQSESLEIDAATRRLPPSSRLLLCSDGLWGVIGDKRIEDILKDVADPQEACDQLIEAANSNNGPDNITAVLLQMPD